MTQNRRSNSGVIGDRSYPSIFELPTSVRVIKPFDRVRYKRFASGADDISGEEDAVIFAITDTSTTRTVTIASAAILHEGEIFIIKDEGGGATANNITIETEGSETIDGSSNVKITGDYGVVRLYSDGENLFTW